MAKAPAGAVRQGTFSAGLCALAVAAVILVNLLAGYLPESWTQFDMTGSGIYDITDTSREYLAGLDEDVEVHVLAGQEETDSRIVRFLDLYQGLSDHLTVEYTDPDVFPSVLSRYGAEANTVVVTCAATGLQETFDIGEIIGYDEMAYYYYGVLQETDFDGEGLLTSAVDAVVTGDAHTFYQTAGHGETALSAAITERFHKAHIALDSVNLLTDGGIPDDCALLIVNAPRTDLAADELTMVRDYLAQGGQVVYTMAGQLGSLPNLEALCAGYGMTVSDGLIADMERFYQNNPYWIFPLADTAVDAASALPQDATVLVYGARGMTLTDPARESITVSSFLTTSDSGVAVVDETDQTPGKYVLGAVATETIDDGTTARLTVLGAETLTDETLAASFPSLANSDLYLSAATAGFTGVSAISIPPVSLTTPTNTIATGGVWALLFIFVIPGALVLCGFVRWVRRRKL